jgi:hypothetical protein
MSNLSERVAAFTEKHPTLYRLVVLSENIFKKPIFGCHDCGQCVLSYNAFTCPMRCPKQIRNGPCGGTRPNGHCEVYPERYCIWWLTYERSKKLGRREKLRKYHIPVDRRLEHTSAWMNMFAGRILPLSLKRRFDNAKEAALDAKAAEKSSKTPPVFGSH